jgi:hypothetical protein
VPNYIKLKASAEELAELHALPDDSLLTTQEAALFLSLSPVTLSWYRGQRIGPEFVKIGTKAVRYSAGALRAYTRKHTRPARLAVVSRG